MTNQDYVSAPDYSAQEGVDICQAPIDIDLVLALRELCYSDYKGGDYAEYKWHESLLGLVIGTYGQDQEIEKAVDFIITSHPLDGSHGKRSRYIYYTKHLVRYYFMKYEGMDYFTTTTPYTARLDFQNGKKINKEGWGSLVRGENFERAAEYWIIGLVMGGIFLLLAFLFGN